MERLTESSMVIGREEALHEVVRVLPPDRGDRRVQLAVEP